MRDYLFARFGGGDFGCFNPNSVASGRPSLHAEGRAGDFAFNANDPDQRAAGDALFVWAVEHAEELGLQEMLWRGAIWFYPRRLTEFGWGDFPLPGVYGPQQQADHMSHVHLGVDWNAANNWTADWIGDDMLSDEDVSKIVGEVARYMTGQNDFLNQAGMTNLGNLYNELIANIGGGGGLSKAQVREVVREELDRTRLVGQ